MAFIGLDVGTTGIKGLLVDEKGKILGKSEYSLRLFSPKPGWAEQNPEEWWNGTKKVLSELSKIAKERQKEILAISNSGQMHSLVMLDEFGRVLSNSILWCDQRTADECQFLTNSLGGIKKVIEIIGNPILPGFTAGKILWAKKNLSEEFKKVKKFLLPKDFINFKLTGNFATEHSDASGTAMYDIKTRKWSKKILDIIGIREEQLPTIINSYGIVGKLNKELAKELGINPETLIIAGGADNACAALGVGVVNPLQGMISLGTSGTVLVPSFDDTPDFEGRVHLFAHVVDKLNYYMGVMLSATNTLNWFMNLLSEEDLNRVNEMVEKIPVGSRGVYFLPYLNGERTPHNNPYARGVIFGLSSSHSKAEVYRAIFEGVGYAIRDCFSSLPKKNLEDLRITGGGSKSKAWVSIISNILGMELTLLSNMEGAAYGAAILAYSGYSNQPPEEIASMWVEKKEVISHSKDLHNVYEKYYEIFRKIYSSLESVFYDLKDLDIE
ncbi:MAG: xylulokinase [Fervidobacterium sp.]